MSWAFYLSLAFSLITVTANAATVSKSRSVVSLNGVWQIAEGSLNSPPQKFDRTVLVPGLISTATPSFLDLPGPVKADEKTTFKDLKRDAFWYRRQFTIQNIPEVAVLKVSKAMFGTQVILNGIPLGTHLPNFTPGYFDAIPALRKGSNEVLIRVGADPAAVTNAIPFGYDMEKSRYIPGIFDSVELVLSSTPHILNVQIAPEIADGSIRIQTHLRNGEKARLVAVSFKVREWRSGKIVARLSIPPKNLGTQEEARFDARISIPKARLWSPEDPFLYTLETDTGGDQLTTRFGLRSFHFDPQTGRGMLNGKTYFLRGSNITLYRFFEDDLVGQLPWDRDWVRKLHQRVKDMHWNTLRYCIGFPPEFWYDIADEEGILLQDEFPIWYMKGGPQELKHSQLITEFTEWMRERWNHPSVVIWDASNETAWSETSPAVQAVRALDLSGRPWDNSWSAPMLAGDSFESHPYHFFNADFKLRDLGKASVIPEGNPMPYTGSNALIINEYGWLWLNRDGSPTTYTKDLYLNLLGPQSTVEQRRELYARYLAAETEFWRAYRKAAGVLHFTSLGYSRPDGQTSDHWSDVAGLQWEPLFYKYVRDAFAPTGLMIENWADEHQAGSTQSFPIVVTNDRDQAWNGTVRLRLLQDGKVRQEQDQPWQVEPFGNNRLSFTVEIPQEPGNFQLEAALIESSESPVLSLRDFIVK